MIQYIIVILIGVAVLGILIRNIYNMFVGKKHDESNCGTGCDGCSMNKFHQEKEQKK